MPFLKSQIILSAADGFILFLFCFILFVCIFMLVQKTELEIAQCNSHRRGGFTA